VVAAPCIGPFVLGLLTWVASMGSPWLGFIVFFTLSLGLGLPLFFLAIFSGQIDKLPRSGEWMIWVKKLMGWVLVGMAAYFIRPILPKAAGIALLATVALAAGLHMGWIDKTKASFRAFDWIRNGIVIISVVMATILIGSWLTKGPGINWQSYSEELLKEAKKLNKPVIIDFYADWCSPCRELEEITFHDAEIVKQAKQDFIMIKVDLTRKDNPVNELLLKEYEVKGVPTVVFLNGKGNERDDLRLVDFLPPNQFLIRMAEMKKLP
jgi:thiol:disulfide interchange protein DsbD